MYGSSKMTHQSNYYITRKTKIHYYRMAKNDNIVVIDLVVNSGDATKNLIQLDKDIKNLKKSQEAWNDALEKGTVTEEQYAVAQAHIKAQMKDYRDQVKANEKVLVENIKAHKANADSLNSMRSQIKLMLKAYDDMSKAERESAKGQDLLNHISDLTKEVKALEYQEQIFKRNVGNYASALEGISPTLAKIAQGINGFSGGTMKLGDAFKNVIPMVKNFGAQMLKLFTNPWVALIGVIVAALAKLVKTFKQNDDAMTALQTAFSAFQPILDLINKGFNALVGVVTKVIQGFTKMVTLVGSLIPGFKQASEAAQQYTKDLDALEEAERQYTVESAKNEAEIADLRDKAADKEHYTAEERIKFNKQAQKLTEENYKRQKSLAKERLRLAKEEQKRDNDYSDERKNKIAELEAAYIKADADYANAHRSLQREQNRFEKEIDAEEKAKEQERIQRAKEWAQIQKERRQNEIQAVREYEDALIAAMDEGFEKQIKQIEVAGKREIEDLKKRLKEEKNLTLKAKEEINKLIELKERELNKKLVLTQADYWSNLRAEISKSMNDSTKFMNAGRLATDLNKISTDLKTKITDIDASGKKVADDLAKAFTGTFEMAVQSGDKLAKQLKDLLAGQPLDFDNFKNAIKSLGTLISEQLGLSMREVDEMFTKNKWISELNKIFNQYYNVIGDQSRQVNQWIIENTQKAAEIVQQSIFDAISNGSVTAYADWLTKHEGFARAMADKFGDSYLDQMKGIMLNVDTMLEEAYAGVTKAYAGVAKAYAGVTKATTATTVDEALLERLRTEIRDLEEIKNVILSTNNAEKETNRIRRERAQLILDGRNTEIEQTKLSLEENKALAGRLQAQQAYLNSIKDTVKAREQSYLQIRKETANQREQLEDQRIALQKLIDQMKSQSISLGIEVDQNTIDQLEAQIADIIQKEGELTKQAAEAANELAATGFASMDEFNAAQDEMVTKIMETNAKIAEDNKKLSDAEINSWITTFNTIADAAAQLSSAFGNLFSALAEDNEEMQKYANAMAYVDIMMSMATGIASAVAEGMKMGWPAAAVMIPVGVATVVGGIAEAIAIYKQNNKVKSAPKFATGGPVDKSTTGGMVGNHTTTRKDDSVDAKLSLGEYVIQSEVVKEYGVDFFDAINNSKKKKLRMLLGDTPRYASGGLVQAPSTNVYNNTTQMDFNYDRMGEVIGEAVAEVHPVVSVREINDMQTRVTVKENTASYK